MDPIDQLQRAQAWTASIIAGVHKEVLHESTPCSDWDVSRLLDHLIADVDTFNRVASGEPLDLVTSIKPDESENEGRATPDAIAAFERVTERAREIWSRPGAVEQTYKTSRSELPGAALFNIFLIEMLVHGWDLAKATGQPTEMPAGLAEAELAFTTKMMKERRMGFEQPVPVPEDASPTDRLVGWLGRTP
jgi:uncharacterized protein (TIGR03086 family)